MVKRVAFAVPGDLATPTGGYAYDRRMIAELQKLGWQVDVVGLGEGFPRPGRGRQGSGARRSSPAVPKNCPIVIDGLALGVLPEAAKELRERNPLLALVHHPLALETGLRAGRRGGTAKERARGAGGGARRGGDQSVDLELLVDDYDVPPDSSPSRVRAPIAARPRRAAATASCGCSSVGAVVPRKGFDVLIAALAALADLPWRLTIAGDRTRDARPREQLDADIAQHGLAARVDVLGAVPPDRLAALYTGADMFVLASRFEGYGMAFAEALAHGLPIVGTTAGAIPDTVPPNAGVLVEPNDVKALTRTLRMLIENPKERQWLAAGARERRRARCRPGRTQAKLFAGAIEAVA